MPYPAGGPLDQVARVMTEHMRGTLGQPFVIENVSGAGGSIGVGRVARATPNGYTISIGDVGTQVLNGAVYPLNYDVMTDFEPVAWLVASPLLVLSRSSLPAKTLTELVAWLKANQEKVSQGFIGSGTLSHLCGLYMQQVTGSKWTFVPYRGAAPAIQDLVGGQVDIMCLAPSGSSLPLARSGKVRAYAIMSPTRLPSAQEIPTADEAGVPGLHLSFWQAFWVPKGTPQGRRRQAQRRRGGGAGGRRRARQADRARTDDPGAQGSDAGGARRAASRGSRQVVADHQEGRHQAGPIRLNDKSAVQ